MPRRPRSDAANLRDMVYGEVRKELPPDVSASKRQGWGPCGREFYIEFAYGREAEFGSGDLCFAADDQHAWLIRAGRMRPSWRVSYERGIGDRLVFSRGLSLEGLARRVRRATVLLAREIADAQ